MKTSFDISEPLLREVKQLAKQRGTTTKSLVEQALVKLLAEADATPAYKLPDLSVPGGLTPEFQNATWEQIRDEIYPLPEPFQSQLR
jgi:hypothetical protein